MTKYFAIEYGRNETLVGKIPQVKDFKHNCNVSDNSDFIDKFPFKKIEGSPILSIPILYPITKQTDIIDTYSNVGFSFGSLVISNKLKEILDQFNCYGFQFFPTYIIQDGSTYSNYWQTHICEMPFEYIDFKKTKALILNIETRKIVTESVEISYAEEFLSIVNSLEYPKSISLKDISFEDKMDLDLFFIRFFENSGRGIVSEKLKNEIEKQECTGIEFRPIELSLQEWYHNGERERVYGKF